MCTERASGRHSSMSPSRPSDSIDFQASRYCLPAAGCGGAGGSLRGPRERDLCAARKRSRSAALPHALHRIRKKRPLPTDTVCTDRRQRRRSRGSGPRLSRVARPATIGTSRRRCQVSGSWRYSTTGWLSKILPSQVVPDRGMPNSRIGARRHASGSQPPRSRPSLRDSSRTSSANAAAGTRDPRQSRLRCRAAPRCCAPGSSAGGGALDGVDDPAETRAEQRLLQPRIDDAIVAGAHRNRSNALLHANEAVQFVEKRARARHQVVV